MLLFDYCVQTFPFVPEKQHSKGVETAAINPVYSLAAIAFMMQ